MPAPTRRPSDEADAKQLEMARQEGEAYHRSLNYMANEVADTGGEQQAGDYIVAFAQERAEGMYMLREEGEVAKRSRAREELDVVPAHRPALRQVAVETPAAGLFVL